MNNKLNRLVLPIFTTLYFCVIFLQSTSAQCGDPRLDYHTLKTPHFNIHYHSGLENKARKIASLAEEIHFELESKLNWTVKGPTNVFIEDFQDSANGMASVIGSPFILLYAAPPLIDSSLQYHDNWSYTLFMHEYTHIVHLQMHEGVSTAVNRIFGDIYLPNTTKPRWFIEGMAIMMETYLTNRGRIRSPYYQMVLRTHALSGHLQNLARTSHTTLSFPRGDADYIYGAMFLDWFVDNFGEKKLISICHEYSKRPIPYALNSVFEKITGHGLDDLYRDWQIFIKDHAQKKVSLLEPNLTKSTALTNSGEYKGRPVFSPDGQILVSMRDGKQRGGIFELTNQKPKQLIIAPSAGDLGITIDRTLYFTRTAPYRNLYRHRELFVLDSNSDQPRQLTHGMRVREFAISQDKRKLLLVTQNKGKTSLILADTNANNPTVLFKAKEGRQFYQPAFSPDSKSAALIVRNEQKVRLALLDLNTKKLRFITDDKHIPRSPVFSADGNYLLFSSEQSGILNVHAFDLLTREERQITNVITGATDPALSPDGSTLVFNYYSHKGWDIHSMPFDFKKGKKILPVSFYETSEIPSKSFEINPFEGQEQPYNPLPSLAPSTWRLGYINSAAMNKLSASISVTDAADLHSFTAEVGYDFQNEVPSFLTGYTYYGLIPTFQLSLSYFSDIMESGYLVGEEQKPWTRRSLNGDVGFSTSLLGLDDHHSVSFGYTLTLSKPSEKLDVTIDPNSSIPRVPVEFFRTGLKFGWSFSDLFSTPSSISIEEGKSIWANFTLYHPAFGGKQELVSLTLGWRQFWPIPFADHHVLAVNFRSGAYLGNPKGQAGYTAGGYTEQNLFDSIWNETPMGLPFIRGYAPRSIKGDHYLQFRMEYRLPIWRPEAGYNTLPLFMSQLHGALFCDNLFMSYNLFEKEDFHTSIGAELVWDLLIGFNMPLTFRTGYARGIMDKGINELIFVLGGTY